MLPQINQRIAINNLNAYLDWHNLPVRMNKRGICRGLACVYAKYVLEDKEEQFYMLLNKIATMDASSELDDEVNHFVVEVLLSFMPQLVDKEKGQHDSIGFLQINGRTLKPSFKTGLITSDENWITLFKDIDLKEHEAMTVCLATHAISLRKKEGHYRIYDPNYPSGVKEFSNEEEAVKELHNISEELGLRGALGMNVEVIRHPNDENIPRKFPNPDGVYTKYFDPKATVLTRDDCPLNSLDFAMRSRHESAVLHLLNRGFEVKDPLNTASMAIDTSNFEVLALLLAKIPAHTTENEFNDLFKRALCDGKKKIFDALLKNDACRISFENALNTNAHTIIHYAAVGANLELLQQVTAHYRNKGTPQPISDELIARKIMEPYSNHGDAICAAINGPGSTPGDPQCVQLLLEQLKKAYYTLDAKQYLGYLWQAVLTNQPHMVELIVDVIKKEFSDNDQKAIFKSISTMSVSAIEQTDLSILRTFKANGVGFPIISNAIIEQKEKRPVGTLLSVGITLVKFADYVSTTLKRQLHAGSKKIDAIIDDFNELKKRVMNSKPADPTPEQEHSNSQLSL